MSPTIELRGRELELPTPSVEAALWWGFVLSLQGAVLGAYLVARGTTLRPFHVYPFVWITVGLWAVIETGTPAASRRHRLTAGTIAVGYFLLLGYAGGLYDAGRVPEGLDVGLRVATSIPPGYGPALLYAGPELTLSIRPYLLIGYLSLAYLVYATVLDAAGSAIAGVVGLLSCISCSWPILASLLAAVLGGGSAAVSAVYAESYALSTAVFVVTVALLCWRPFAR